MVSRVLARAAAARGIAPAQAEMLHELRGLTPEGIEALPDAPLRAAARRMDYPDMPRARIGWRLAQSRGDDGGIPEQPLVAALQELDSLRARAVGRAIAGVPTGRTIAPSGRGIAALAGLHLRTWKALGPVNIGGRTRSILIHPTKPKTIWAGSIGGGIWRSIDGGAKWAPVDDFMANLAVTSLIMDPLDSNHIYAATGEGFGNADEIRGGGIFETVDGLRWRPIAATATPIFRQINRIALSADGKTLLAGTVNGLHRSVDAARAVWATVISDRIADVKFHPTNSSLAVAGSIGSGKSWFTTDGGATWKESTHGAPWDRRVELCYARANPNIVYASTMNANGTIWRSIDGGKSFLKRKSLNKAGQASSYLGDQGWYGNVIWAGDPTSADLVLTGGVDLWRSTDGGDSLVEISTWYDNRSAHADHHAIVADPGYNGTTNRILWCGNDGGVYRAADARTVGNNPTLPRIAGWTSRNNGYAVTQFFAGAANVSTGMIVAGAQDNGTLAYKISKGDGVWRTIFGGDGGYCCADQADKKIFYGQYVYLDIHRNTDGATSNSGNYISGHFWNSGIGAWDWKPVPFRIPDAFNQRALFIAPFVLDPRNSNRIFAGGESLWRTDDARTANTSTSGPKWARIKPPADGFISAVAISPANSDHVWIGHERGQVWRTTNAGAAAPVWQQIDNRGPKPLTVRRMCTQLLVSPHDPKRVLAAFGGFERDNIWLTDDTGATWRAIAAGLPAAPIRAAAIHPGKPSWFYVGTEVGLFASEDNGSTWSPSNEGPANVSVEDMFWIGEKLVCVTHGRGLFMIDLSGF